MHTWQNSEASTYTALHQQSWLRSERGSGAGCRERTEGTGAGAGRRAQGMRTGRNAEASMRTALLQESCLHSERA